MLTLYDMPFSGNGYKVRLTLRELAIPYRYVEVDVLGGETRSPGFLARNPAGQIPVLELPDGRCLSESTAITCFLAEGTALLPDERFTRACVLQWMSFEQTNIDGVVSRARFRRMYPDAVPTRPEEFVVWWRDGYRALDVLEARLDQRLWLVDDGFTLADIALYAYVHKAEDGGFDLSRYPALRAWFTRVEARPAHIAIDRPGGGGVAEDQGGGWRRT